MYGFLGKTAFYSPLDRMHIWILSEIIIVVVEPTVIIMPEYTFKVIVFCVRLTESATRLITPVARFLQSNWLCNASDNAAHCFPTRLDTVSVILNRYFLFLFQATMNAKMWSLLQYVKYCSHFTLTTGDSLVRWKSIWHASDMTNHDFVVFDVGCNIKAKCYVQNAYGNRRI